MPDGAGGTIGVAGLAVDLSANAGWGSRANTAETSDYAAAYSGTSLVHLAKAATRISLSPDRTTAVEGTAIGLSGTVERESATGWQPAAGVSVSLYGTAAGCRPPSQTVAKTVRKNHYITASGKLTRAVSMTRRTGYAGQRSVGEARTR